VTLRLLSLFAANFAHGRQEAQKTQTSGSPQRLQGLIFPRRPLRPAPLRLAPSARLLPTGRSVGSGQKARV